MPPFVNFAGGSDAPDSAFVDSERSVNWFPVKAEAPGAKAPLSLKPTPGLTVQFTLPTAPALALLEINGRVFAATPQALYEIVYSGGTISYVSRGSLNSGLTSLHMATNGKQICIVSSGTNLFPTGAQLGGIFDLTANTLTPITPTGSAAGFSGGSNVICIDGYFIVLTPNSQTFYISGLYDGTSWSALDFANARGGPDNLVQIIANNRELWLFGQQRIECYYDSGNAGFPFSRNNNVFIETGCAAAETVCQFGGTLAWLGRDKRGGAVVYLLNGYTPQRISNSAIEYYLQGYRQVNGASDYTGVTAFVMQRLGRTFYVLRLPTYSGSPGYTFVYDLTTGLWHEWLSWDAANSRYVAHIGGPAYVFAFGMRLITDAGSGLPGTNAANIYQIADVFYTDAGIPIQRMRTAPHLVEERKRLFYRRFSLDLNLGYSDSDGSPAAYSVLPAGTTICALSWSDDGGQTYSLPLPLTTNDLTSAKNQIAWRRLGHARDRIFRVTSNAAYGVTLANAFLELDEGRS